jgi:hypothetical protein
MQTKLCQHCGQRVRSEVTTYRECQGCAQRAEREYRLWFTAAQILPRPDNTILYHTILDLAAGVRMMQEFDIRLREGLQQRLTYEEHSFVAGACLRGLYELIRLVCDERYGSDDPPRHDLIESLRPLKKKLAELRMPYDKMERPGNGRHGAHLSITASQGPKIETEFHARYHCHEVDCKAPNCEPDGCGAVLITRSLRELVEQFLDIVERANIDAPEYWNSLMSGEQVLEDTEWSEC